MVQRRIRNEHERRHGRARPVLRSAPFIILVDQILDPLEQEASLLGPDFGFEVHRHIFAE